MKGRVAGVVAVALLIAAGAGAQQDMATQQGEAAFPSRSVYQRVNMSKVEKYFAASLDYEIDGIVESALANIVLVYIAQPGYTSDRLKERITNLSLYSGSTNVRRKAYLAALVLGAPALFAPDAEALYTSSDELFSALAARLEHSLHATQ